jgi:hypothetical protein
VRTRLRYRVEMLTGAGSLRNAATLLGSALNSGVTIDLASGTATDGTNTVSWDPGVIEGALGGFGNDTISGNADENNVRGHEGADVLDVSGDPPTETEEWIDRADCGNDTDADRVTIDEADTTANCDSEDTITVVPRATVNSASAP